MPRKELNSILIKPAGPDCNMRCAYCFYLEKAAAFPDNEVHRMSETVLEAMIRQFMAQGGRHVSFGWQGGEPTLMGLPFFERAVELQKRYGRGQQVGNGLQTNGILIDDKWARFLAEYNFLVGLSLDGEEHVHNRYRPLRGGGGSWARVVESAGRMLDAGVAVNALSVVNDYSVRFPEETYSFLKKKGLTYMQFIPIVERDRDDPSALASFSVPPKDYGAFLCTLFDLWRADFDDGTPTTSIRFFESLFYRYVGLEPPECTLHAECGVYVVVEHNGDVYSCDFFVDPEWKLGNVLDGKLIDMLNSKRQNEFGAIKAALPAPCRECRWVEYCRGGCPKDRLFPAGAACGSDGEKGSLNHLCEAFQTFFEHAHEPLVELATGWKRQQALAAEAEREAYEAAARQSALARSPSATGGGTPGGAGQTGRNDPCPCGSGRKFKKCCGRQ